MSLLRDLLIRIRGDNSQFEKTANQTTGTLDRLKTRANALAASLGGVLKTAALAAGAAMGLAVKSAVAYASRLDDVSNSLGVTTEALARLQYAAKLSGVEADTLNGALNLMRRNLAEAAVNGGPLKDALNNIGLSAADLSRLAPDQQFERITQALSELPAGAARTQAAFAIFGRGAGGILPLLNEGAESIRLLGEEADRLGVALNNVEAAKLGAVGDAGDRAMFAMQGLANTIGLELAPYLDAAGKAFVKVMGYAIPAVQELHKGFLVLGAGITNIFMGSLSGAARMLNGFIRGAKVALNTLPFVDVDASRGGLEEFIASTQATAQQAARDAAKISQTQGSIRFDSFDREAEQNAAKRLKSIGGTTAAVQQLGKEAEKTAEKIDILWDDEKDAKWQQMADRVRDIQLKGMDPLTRGVARYSDTLKKAQKDGEDWAKNAEDAFRGLEDVVVNFATTGRLQLGDFFRQLQNDIARTVVQRSITGPLSSAIGNSLSAAFSTYFGGPSTAPGTFFSSGELAGARASGGPVGAFRPYLVGERGPELFVPQTQGTIVPRDRLGGGGGTPVTVNQTLQIGLGVQQGVRQELAAMLPSIQAQTQAGVLTAIERGGPLARAVGRR